MKRLDQWAVERGLFASRQRAGAHIRAHGIRVDGQVIHKPGRKFSEDIALELLVEPMPWVGRGALKLLDALEHWNLQVEGGAFLDIGSSTGGFTEVLLDRGAQRVVAVDSGSDQLADSLRNDPRVELHEQTDFRVLSPAHASGLQGFVCDVSFISLRHILPRIPELFDPGAWGVVLVKPQFEAGPERVGKNGIVRDPAVQEQVLQEICAFAQSLGFQVQSHKESPITGGDGNREFLLWLALPLA